MRPLLEIVNEAKGQEVKLRDVINKLADKFHITEEEKAEKLPSGKQSVLDNRVGWARTYLSKSGLLEVTKRAHFIITDRGINALKDKQAVIDKKYLKQFDEFIAFTEPKHEDSETIDIMPIDTDEITPDEVLRAAYKKINSALSADLLERTSKVTPAFFEDLLIELLVAMGYGNELRQIFGLWHILDCQT